MEVTTCHGIELKQEKVQSLVFSLDLKNVSYCFFSKEEKKLQSLGPKTWRYHGCYWYENVCVFLFIWGDVGAWNVIHPFPR